MSLASKWFGAEMTVGLDGTSSLLSELLARLSLFHRQTLEEIGQVGLGKPPVERPGPAVGQLLIQPQPQLDLGQVGEVIGREDFALYHREVDLHLVEPTCMHRRVYQDGVGVTPQYPPLRRRAPMRRAVVHDPEHPLRAVVRLLGHHLLYQSPKRLDPRL